MAGIGVLEPLRGWLLPSPRPTYRGLASGAGRPDWSTAPPSRVRIEYVRAGPAVSAGELVRAIGEVLRVVGRSGSDLGVTLEAIAEHANRLCDAEYSYVYLAQGESLHLAASSGGSAEQWAYEREHPTALGRTTLVGRVASERAIQHIHDVRADPEYDNPVAQELGGYRTLLGVPIEYEGELIGVIGLARTDVRPFEQAQVELTAGFAYQAALAIGVARSCARTGTPSSVSERSPRS